LIFWSFFAGFGQKWFFKLVCTIFRQLGVFFSFGEKKIFFSVLH